MSADAGAVEPGALHESEPMTSAPEAASTPGELLRAAREERNLSVQQVADDLHLDVPVVQAIEANHFERLGPPVYSRGHLRKYAQLVGVAPDHVIERFEMLSDVPAVPTPVPVMTSAPPPPRVSLRVPMLAVSAIAVAGVAVWIAAEWFDRPAPRQTAVPAAAPSVQMPEVSEPVEAQAQSGTTQSPSSASAGAEVASASPQVSSVSQDVTVRLRFSDASWVEIHDGDERRLLYEIGQPGQTRTVTGAAPLRVTLGMASAVSMEVDEQAVPVPRRTGRNAARFEIEADGSVR